MDRLSLIKIDYFSCFSKFHSRLLIIVSLFFFISLAHDHWFDTVLCKPFFCILSFVFFRFKIYSLHSQFNCVICSRFVDFSPVSLRWVGRTGSIGTIIDDNHHYQININDHCQKAQTETAIQNNLPLPFLNIYLIFVISLYVIIMLI